MANKLVVDKSVADAEDVFSSENKCVVFYEIHNARNFWNSAWEKFEIIVYVVAVAQNALTRFFFKDVPIGSSCLLQIRR